MVHRGFPPPMTACKRSIPPGKGLCQEMRGGTAAQEPLEERKMGKIRKCGYTCCACYRIFSLLIKRYGHLKIPAKEQKKTQKNRSHFTSSVKRPLFVQFDRSVNGCLNDRQVFFWAELQFVVYPLALFGVLCNQGGIEIPLHRQLANPYELQHHGHAWNCLIQFDIGKIARINADLFCQCPAGDIQSFPCGLHIGAEGFKPRTIFNFSHITSPSYILYFIVSLENDAICR